MTAGRRTRIAAAAGVVLAVLVAACTAVAPRPTPAAPATGTPVPAAPLPTREPCSVVATRTPPPGAPTLIPVQPAGSPSFVDPHVEVCAVPPAVKVGESLSVVGEPVSIGLPSYSLYVQDAGAAEPAMLGEVSYGNEPRPPRGRSQLLELVSAQGTMDRAVFVLRAVKPGTAQVWISATGEIHYGFPGPATWAGGGSAVLTITVAEP